MLNEPNLQNPQISLTIVPKKAYMKIDASAPTKNEHKTNPIWAKTAYPHSGLKSLRLGAFAGSNI